MLAIQAHIRSYTGNVHLFASHTIRSVSAPLEFSLIFQYVKRNIPSSERRFPLVTQACAFCSSASARSG